MENEQLNHFGQKVKDALEHPADRKDYAHDNTTHAHNDAHNDPNFTPDTGALEPKSKAHPDNSMDAISQSIDVMIMKEAKMNDYKLNVIDLFKTIRNAFKEVEKNFLMNILRDKINKFFIMERQGKFQFL